MAQLKALHWKGTWLRRAICHGRDVMEPTSRTWSRAGGHVLRIRLVVSQDGSVDNEELLHPGVQEAVAER